jgi:hypothetical protein
MHTRRGFLALACATSVVPPAFAKRGDWITLGTRRVSLFKDRDLTYVGLKKGRFTGVELQISGRRIFMERLKVRFLNDDSAELPVRNFIKAGIETREILLPSLVRAIRLIETEYRKVPTGRESLVTALGRQA